MPHHRPCHLLRALGLLMIISTVVAQEPREPNEQQRERLRQAMQTLLISLVQDPSFKAMAESDWNLTYAQDSQALSNFGVIFSSRFDRETNAAGLLVLAVTPNSTAAEMGVRIGDRVQRLNGRTLLGLGVGRAEQSRAYAQFAALLGPVRDGGSVTVQVERNGRILELAGSLERWNLPAVSLALSVRDQAGSDGPGGEDDQPKSESELERDPCATLSLHHSPPHKYDLYPAYLTGINAAGSGAVMRRFQYLKPGSYKLTLSDVIPARELRMRHTRFEDRRQAKELILEVEDAMVYHLGARLLHDRKEQRGQAEYWQPVVWRMEPGYCKGRPVAR